ncbi:MAG: hypothetical protein KAS66_14595 [Candidatus Omnitrophica bacterium]|nr:hypothetical protein [Candidatus Omnitrophota bacterium]
MAIIIPFADPDAHGSIAGSVSFRRRRGKVVFQKKPHGKQPNTPAQQAQKEKFSDGWKAYHQLDAWAIEYLTNKAAELGTTKANLFLSQFLLDEIPSTFPLNQIKNILNLSLPEPEAPIDEGQLYEFFSQIDDPFSQSLLGHIYDKENIVSIGATVGVHSRSLIRIENKEVGAVVIPFDYPLIIDYKDLSDVEHTQLIRLPEISLPAPGTPSTTKWNNIKSVQGLTIVDPQQSGVADMQIELHQIVGGTNPIRIIASIDDNRNSSNEFTVQAPYSDTYIEFADNKGTPLVATKGLVININWTDSGDTPHNDVLTFPRVENANGGGPSTSGTNDMRNSINMEIKYTQEATATGMTYALIAAGTGADVGQILGGVTDNNNNYTDQQSPSDYTVLSMNILNNDAFEKTLNEGYSIVVEYINALGETIEKSIVLPQLTIPASSSKTIYFADDFSVYDEVGLSTLLLKGYINTKKLWLADDFSMYWDQALTNLAISPKQSITEIFLASDFSTYFDEALSQLGNTPFY